LACEALERGSSPDLVAQNLGVSRSSVFDWQKTYRERGKEALRTKKTPGPQTKLSDGQMSQLYTLITGTDPRQLSFRHSLWTRRMIRELIAREFGITLTMISVDRVLERLGMSPQRPLDQASELAPDQVAEWKDRTFPQIQAEARRIGALIFFVAEAPVRTSYYVGPPQLPPILMMSALSPRGELHFAIAGKEGDPEGFLAFCEKLIEDARRPVFLILESPRVLESRRAGRAMILNEFAAQRESQLTLHFLPPYASERGRQ
jgi:transposase